MFKLTVQSVYIMRPSSTVERAQVELEDYQNDAWSLTVSHLSLTNVSGTSSIHWTLLEELKTEQELCTQSEMRQRRKLRIKMTKQDYNKNQTLHYIQPVVEVVVKLFTLMLFHPEQSSYPLSRCHCLFPVSHTQMEQARGGNTSTVQRLLLL